LKAQVEGLEGIKNFNNQQIIFQPTFESLEKLFPCLSCHKQLLLDTESMS
jgi:hypothetical protein